MTTTSTVWIKSMAAAAVAAVLGTAALPSGALAQSAPAPAAADPTSQWVRECGTDPASKKEVCDIHRPLFTDGGIQIAEARMREVKGETRRTLLILVPSGMLIQPGLRVGLDDKKPDIAKYTICVQNACFAELPLPDDTVAQFKKAGKLFIVAVNGQNKAISFGFGLDGFTAAYDGPPLDAASAEKNQQQLKDELERKAKAASQKLIDAQKAATQSK